MPRKNYFVLGIDCLIILLNIISGGLSILPMLFLFNSIPYNLVLVTIINIVWSIGNSRYLRLSIFPHTFIPFSCVLFYQIFLGRLEFSIAMFALNMTFFFVLTGILGKYKDKAINVLSNTYISYSFINVVCVCLGFLLIVNGFLDPFTNALDVSILAKDDELAFFPGHLTVFRPDDSVRVSFLPTLGLFCGFSHEPHVVGYICIPAFFMLLYRIRNRKRLLKIVVITFYAFFFLITLSATSFISLGIVTCVGLFMSGQQKGHKGSWFVLGVLIVLVVVAFTFISDSFSFVFDKLNAEGGSRDYSQERLSYAFTPNTILGTTIYASSVDGDIGIVTAVFNIWFYISAGLLCLKMLRNKNREVFYYGLALFYFLCHSMKIIIMIYRYPFTLFMIFLAYQLLILNTNKKTSMLRISNPIQVSK